MAFSPFFFAIAVLYMKISNHFKNRSPSAIRSAQILFSKRKDIDDIKVVNMAIGNISLPMYPAMLKR